MTKQKPLPILYSFRRCPYAIRARMAIVYSGLSVELREVILKDKPKDMLLISPKGTVPVIQLADNIILDESLDIMAWAISQCDPFKIHLLGHDNYFNHKLIEENDGTFKAHLDHYKYARNDQLCEKFVARAQGEVFLEKLNTLLENKKYLLGDNLSVVDIAIFPFIRQFAHVDIAWFERTHYVNLNLWLNDFMRSKLFTVIMNKYNQWNRNETATVLPAMNIADRYIQSPRIN